MEYMGTFDRLLDQASFLLRETLGRGVVLSAPVVMKDGARSLTLRCAVTSSFPGISSIIVRQIREDGSRGFSDWASLAFLSGLPEARGLVPCFYDGDIANRFFLMEDLGKGNSLQDLLTGTDPAASRAALRALASQMGRLQAATFQKQDQFEAIRGSLPETGGVGRGWEAGNWLEQRGKIEKWFATLGCVVPDNFHLCLERISNCYREADGWLTFTQGDPAPTNNHFARGRVRLLDLEYGGFRHALYDLTGWNILCPLPTDCVGEMRDCFREELAKACPAAGDEGLFAKEWAYLCAYRALAMLTWIPPDIIDQNRIWAENWTMREALFVAMSRLKQVVAPFAELEAVRVAAERFVESMHRVWPSFGDSEDSLPVWAGLR